MSHCVPTLADRYSAALQSLVELYDDAQGKQHFPNEAEFRAFRQARQAFYAGLIHNKR